MARSHLAWRSARPGPASRTAKVLARPVRAILVTATAAALAGAPLLAGTAAAQPENAALQASPLQMNVTSFSPSFAEQGHPITITGRIRNATSSPVSGLTVEAWSSSARFESRTDLESFAHGTYQPGEAQVTGVPAVTKAQLDAGHSWIFTLRLPVSALGLSCFGVYPLTVQVSDSALQVASEPVPLPFWPSSPSGCAGSQRPKPFPVSWIWPLIDVPHQGVCPGLTSNALATTLGPSGRLGYLLAVGRRYAQSAALTWAVDPALLASARAMRGPHVVGSTSRCDDYEPRPASENARAWLAALAKATKGQPLFVTPYADVDEAALANYGDNADLAAAIAAGNKVAREILGRRPMSPIAWPPGGNASEALFNALAGKGASTVILTAPARFSGTFTPGAVTSKLAGIGKYLHVLLADRPIRILLGSRQAASADSGDIFRVTQLYLAQTAMIAAEAPASVRPIVVAPPRRWNPPRRLASGLLANTVAAPWLTPMTASQLATMPPEHLYPQLATSVSRGAISGTLLKQVDGLEKKITLLQSIRVRPDPDLNRAVFAIESSAWRGNAGKRAKLLLARTRNYVDGQLGGLSIRGSSSKHSVLHVTFGGRSSSVPVAIYNALHYAVRVKLHVVAKYATVSGVPPTITIPPQSYSQSVKITVHASKNRHGTIKLSLMSPDGRPLPANPLTIVVRITDLGLIALTIASVALALFVIASALRAIRSGRGTPPAAQPATGTVGSGGPGGAAATGTETSEPGSADQEAAVAEDSDREPSDREPAEPEPAVPEPAGYQPLTAGTENSAQGLVQAGSRTEHIDSVGANGSNLVSSDYPLADQESTPARRGNKEHR